MRRPHECVYLCRQCGSRGRPRTIALLEEELREAIELLKQWEDALYECRAKGCRDGREKMHLRNFNAARPTLGFLQRIRSASQ